MKRILLIEKDQTVLKFSCLSFDECVVVFQKCNSRYQHKSLVVQELILLPF